MGDLLSAIREQDRYEAHEKAIKIKTQMEKEIVKNELELFVQENKLSDLFPNYSVFNEFIEQAKEWREKGMSLKVTSLEQVEEMAQAREGRLALRNVRTAIERKRKDLKEESLKKGKAIDLIAKYLTSLVEPTEIHLDEQEKFVENLQEEIRQKRKIEREESLKVYGVETGFFDLASMPEETFTNLLENSKLAYESRLANEKKVEEEKIRLEKINGRINQVKELGFKYDGLGKYYHEYDLSISNPVIEDCEEEVWTALILELGGSIAEIKAGKDKELEELRLAKVESDKKIKEAEDAANKLKEEQAKKESDLLARNNLGKSRQKLLADIGVPVEFDLAADMVIEDWNKFFNKHIDDYNARKKAEQEAADLLAKREADRIKAEQEKEAQLQAELSKGDKEKFETLINDLEALKTKYAFKSKKHQKLSSEVNELLTKVINHINSKK